MKKWILGLGLLACFSARADEGMWLPHLLGQQKYAALKAKGLKLTAEQLYCINKSSLKDAIIIFGGGCTGEIVSAEGLIFTNHHCGYGNIAKASTMEHNYLRDGFYAKSKSEEIPSAGLNVQFLVKITDVTKQVQDSMKLYPNYTDWTAKKTGVLDNIAKAATEGTHYEARIFSMYKDNQYLQYTFERFKDVRLVGTPPESVGKFGGNTDNWEWPRHTGDFSIFRVYMGKDGKPAAYSADNVPYKAKHFLPISLKGVKEGDFSMIFGYPGSTNRFETSYGVQLASDVKNPAFVYMRDIRLKAMDAEMKKSEATKLKLANSFAGLANYWKFYDGESKQLLKYDVYSIKKKNEAALAAWAKNKPAYANIFADYDRAYAAWKPFAKHKEYYEQGIMGPELMKFAQKLEVLERMMAKSGSDTALKRNIGLLSVQRNMLFESLDLPSEQKMLSQLVKAFNTDIVADQQPVLFYSQLKQTFGALKESETFNLWAAHLVANTMVLDDAKWKDFVANPSAGTLQADPLYATVAAFRKNWDKFKPAIDAFNKSTNELGHLYLKAYLEMNPTKVMYPDANFSMRTSFGSVKSYRPKDGVFYDYVTTSAGLLEKYKAGDYEFDLPKKQVELIAKKDFGRYADKRTGDLVVNFLTNDDITGGNSGSPVINGSGQLIGLAFDGNYEALSHKINFDANLNRTICVDIRYVLWCIDKLGGASNIIQELKIVP